MNVNRFVVSGFGVLLLCIAVVGALGELRHATAQEELPIPLGEPGSVAEDQRCLITYGGPGCDSIACTDYTPPIPSEWGTLRSHERIILTYYVCGDTATTDCEYKAASLPCYRDRFYSQTNCQGAPVHTDEGGDKHDCR